jgi:hypothetical protein
MPAKVKISVKGNINDVKKAIRKMAAAPEVTKETPLRSADAFTRLKKARNAV